MKIVLSDYHPNWILRGRGKKFTSLTLQASVTGKVLEKFRVGGAVKVTKAYNRIPVGIIGAILEIGDPRQTGCQNVLHVDFGSGIREFMKPKELQSFTRVG